MVRKINYLCGDGIKKKSVPRDHRQSNKGAKIRNRYNQVSHLTQDTNGKVTNSQLDTTNDSQEVNPFPGTYKQTRTKA